MSQPSPNPKSEKLTRKQRRRQSPIEVENLDDTPNARLAAPVISLATLPPEMASPVRILVCSIGNPAPYTNTFHSAGHNVLSSIASSLGYSSFHKSRVHGNGLLSIGSEFTLWQSSAYMNVSGAAVAAAWKQFVKDAHGEPTKLVVVHDELELPLGQVKVRKGTASAKGHNGLKSINTSIRGDLYTRIGIGIGRPESREPDVVAAYVLKKMSGNERLRVEGCVGKVVEELRKMNEG